MRKLVVLGLLLLLAACSRDALLEKFSRPSDRALARSAISDLQRGDLKALERLIVPEQRADLSRSFGHMRAIVPPGQPRLVDASFVSGPSGERTSNLAYAIDGDGRHAAIILRIVDDGQTAGIETFWINPLKVRAEDSNDFTLEGKPASSYAILLPALAMLGLCLAAIGRVWRSGLFTRRWLWTLGCMMGVGKLVVNWSFGTYKFMPIAFQIVPVGAVKNGLLAPWQLYVSIPVVALIALFRRDRPTTESE